MEVFPCGKYLGQTSNQLKLSGLTISKSSCPNSFSSSWHSHENTYMTLILKGSNKEKRKNQEIACSAGMLLLYPKNKPHINLNYENNTRNLNIEFEDAWFEKFNIDTHFLKGQSLIYSPIIKNNIVNIIPELNEPDILSNINIETLLLNAITILSTTRPVTNSPRWIIDIKEILHDEFDFEWDLTNLSKKIGVHPVTISKYFSKYFHTTIGDYIRKIKIEKSLSYLSKRSIPLDTISAKLGFYDNAHFTRTFKKYTGMAPSEYRQFIAG